MPAAGSAGKDNDGGEGKEEKFVPGDEWGEPQLLFGDGVGEVLEVSSEQDFGKFSCLMKNKGSWHSNSIAIAKRNKVKADAVVQFAVVDFGGAGDEIYEVDYMWLRNDHSSAFSVEYKDPESNWQVLVPWRSCEPYEFISLSEVRVQAAELKLLIRGSRVWDASWNMVKIYGRLDPFTNFTRELKACLYARDDLDELRRLIKKGGLLRLQVRTPPAV